MLEIATVVCFIDKLTSKGLKLFGHPDGDGSASLHTQRIAEMWLFPLQ